jgi:hypothetical protein
MRNKFRIITIILELLFFIHIALLYSQEEKIFSRAELVQDTRQLAQTLESAHPDPYIRGGGKIAFHRRFQEIIRAIPDKGMTKEEFCNLLLPFVAAVGDGHTRIFIEQSKQSFAPGLPFGFRIVGELLCVDRVYNKNHESFFGAKLLAIEGVDINELLHRQGNLRGYDNKYHNLMNLTKNIKLKQGLVSLLSEWKNSNNIRIKFRLATGEEIESTFSLSEDTSRKSFTPKTKIKLPNTERADIVYDFLDKEKQTSILRIDSLMTYREAFEFAHSIGFTLFWPKEFAQKVYRRFHQIDPPEKIEDIIAGIPSATEIFRSLFTEMKNAGTKTIIVDLRKNQGGNSLIGFIFIYFLQGAKVAESTAMGYQIKKYSDLYFQNYREMSLEKINQERELLLHKDDYDFKKEMEYRKKEFDLEKRDEEREKQLKYVPTFEAEYKTREYENYYKPEKVVVLTSAWTWSGGFDVAASLYDVGAKLVGTPSSQAGNCFIDILQYKLTNTGIQGGISYTYNLMFPDDAEKGKVLRPHYEFTYDKLASYNFDPNAEILYALEILPKVK